MDAIRQFMIQLNNISIIYIILSFASIVGAILLIYRVITWIIWIFKKLAASFGLNSTSGVLPADSMQRVTRSTTRRKWDSGYLPSGVSLAIWMSWIIWVIVMCLNSDGIWNILNLKFSPWPPLLIFLSSILLFFFWGWIIGQNSGKIDIDDSGFLACGVGVIAIICASDICAAIHYYQTIGGGQGGIVGFLVYLFFGLLLSIIPFILAIPISLISTFLGGLIGEGIYRLRYQ